MIVSLSEKLKREELQQQKNEKTLMIYDAVFYVSFIQFLASNSLNIFFSDFKNILKTVFIAQKFINIINSC